MNEIGCGWLSGANFRMASVPKLRIELCAGLRHSCARIKERMFVGAAAMGRLAEYRDEILYDQSPAEARQVQLLAARLRRALAASGLTRGQFAARTGLALELIVAVENGFGRPESARRVLELARPGVEPR